MTEQTANPIDDLAAKVNRSLFMQREMLLLEHIELAKTHVILCYLQGTHGLLERFIYGERMALVPKDVLRSGIALPYQLCQDRGYPCLTAKVELKTRAE